MKRSTAREIAVRLCFIISETSESPEVILSDMFESLIAAMYLDTGIDNTRDFLYSVYGDKIKETVTYFFNNRTSGFFSSADD